MNHLHRGFLSFGLVIGLLVAVPAMGQGGGQVVSEQVKETATYPMDESGKKLIAAVIAAAMNDISNADPAQQKTGRETLLRATLLANGKPTSAVYQDEFATQLNAALLAGPLGRDAKMKARLNAGIALAGVVVAIPNNRLEPSVLALMDDKQPDAVAVWGVRSARPLTEGAFARGQAPSGRLLDGIVAAVKSHPSGGIVQEAYSALIVEEGAKSAVLSATVLPRMLDVFEARVKSYAKALPEDPELEAEGPMLYLTKFSVWTDKDMLGDKQRQRVAQLFADLVSLAAQHAPNPKHRDPVLRVVKTAGSCLVVLGKTTGDEGLQGAAQGMMMLGDNASAQQIAAAAKGVHDAMKKTMKVNDAPTVVKGGN